MSAEATLSKPVVKRSQRVDTDDSALCVCGCVGVLESSDRNSEMIKQEVARLQEMLNRLDFKRKVLCVCICVYFPKKHTERQVKTDVVMNDGTFDGTIPSTPTGSPVQNGCPGQGNR